MTTEPPKLSTIDDRIARLESMRSMSAVAWTKKNRSPELKDAAQRDLRGASVRVIDQISNFDLPRPFYAPTIRDDCMFSASENLYES